MYKLLSLTETLLWAQQNKPLLKMLASHYRVHCLNSDCYMSNLTSCSWNGKHSRRRLEPLTLPSMWETKMVFLALVSASAISEIGNVRLFSLHVFLFLCGSAFQMSTPFLKTCFWFPCSTNILKSPHASLGMNMGVWKYYREDNKTEHNSVVC